jgi:hypothetical protein
LQKSTPISDLGVDQERQIFNHPTRHCDPKNATGLYMQYFCPQIQIQFFKFCNISVKKRGEKKKQQQAVAILVVLHRSDKSEI